MKGTKRLTVLLLALIILLPAALTAQSRAAVLVLLIEPGARPGALGGAYVAQVDDAFSSYWNPGAMAFNEKNQVSWLHTNWFGDVSGIDDMYLEHIAWVTYLEEIGNIGVNIHYFTYGEQTHVDENNTVLGTFTSYEVFPSISYGYRWDQNLGLGISFKFIYSDLAPEETGYTTGKGVGKSWAFDFGVKHRDLFVPGLDFGLNLQNVGPDITYINEDQKDPLPMNWRMGFSYRAIEDEMNKLTLNADMNKELANDDAVLARIFTAWTDDDFGEEMDSTIWSVGAEYEYWNLIALRAGYTHDEGGNMKGYSFGFGIHSTLKEIIDEDVWVSLDFAMKDGGDLVDFNKLFSMSVKF